MRSDDSRAAEAGGAGLWGYSSSRVWYGAQAVCRAERGEDEVLKLALRMSPPGVVPEARQPSHQGVTRFRCWVSPALTRLFKQTNCRHAAYPEPPPLLVARASCLSLSAPHLLASHSGPPFRHTQLHSTCPRLTSASRAPAQARTGRPRCAECPCPAAMAARPRHATTSPLPQDAGRRRRCVTTYCVSTGSRHVAVVFLKPSARDWRAQGGRGARVRQHEEAALSSAAGRHEGEVLVSHVDRGAKKYCGA